VTEEAAPDEVSVTIRVEEGAPVVLGQIDIDVSAVAPGLQESLTQKLVLRVGDVFTADAYLQSKQAIESRLADAGHPRARITGGARVRTTEHRAAVDWGVEPGPHVTLGAVEVEGVERVDAQLVRDELDIAPGDTYRRSALTRSQRDVFDLGLFSRVTIEPSRPDALEPAQEETWPVRVKVSERPPRSVSFGVGYGTEEKLRARVGWEHRNLWGSARRFALEARHSSLLSRLTATLEQPRFLDTATRLGTQLSAEHQNTPSFEADRILAGIGLTRRLGSGRKGRLGWKLDRSRIDDVSDASDLELDDPEDTVVLSYFDLGLMRSTLDDPVDPRRGHRLGLDSWLAASGIGSDFSFGRVELKASLYHELGPVVLATRVRIGGIEPLGATSSDEIPLVARFFSGGSQWVRGYELQAVGPADDSGEALGGTSVAEASVELRIPLWRDLRGVIFLDAGVVDLNPWSWPLSQTKYGSGVGLRYPTPVGPIRVDLGVPLNPEEDDDSIQLYLGVGHPF
jgi:outer membrane protein assembly complex protein YaeT